MGDLIFFEEQRITQGAGLGNSSGKTSDAGRLGTQGYVLPWNGTVEICCIAVTEGTWEFPERTDKECGDHGNRGRFCGAPWNRGRAAVEQVSGWRQESGLELED